MEAQIGAPVEMSTHMLPDSRYLKELPVLGGCVGQRFFEHRPQRSAKPIMRRNVEAGFLSLQDLASEFAAHEIAQDYFLPFTLNLQIRRK